MKEPAKENLDQLRTALANERTLLAYIRTALSMIVFGMAAVKFFPDIPGMVWAGWCAIAGGVVLLAWGVVHCGKISRRLKE